MVGSLALLADAGHMLSDAAALALTLFALRVARLPADPRRTYGYHRAEVLAAVANAAALFLIGGWVLIEAWRRWGAAQEISGPLMLVIAAGGLVVNALGLLILQGADRSGLNVRAAWLHLMSDALGSAGALFAGGLIWWKGWNWADPLASAFISVLVLRSAWGLLSDAVGVLMEGVPAHIDLEKLRTTLEAVDGVAAVHDIHVWTITNGIVAMSGHVVAHDGQSHAAVLNRVAAVLRGQFGIWHSTIQVEPEGFEEAEMHR
jgi:cobalt-zinc-cadmium efflux system protein